MDNGIGAAPFGVLLLPLIFVTVLQPLTVEAGVRSQTSPCGSCGGQSGNGTGFSLTISVFSW